MDSWTLEQCRSYLEGIGAVYPDLDPWASVEPQELASLAAELGVDDFEEDENGGVPIPGDYYVPHGDNDAVVDVVALRDRIIEAIDDEDVDGIEDWRSSVREHMDDNPYEFEPMMNYYYPLPYLSMSAEDAQDAVKDTPCVVVLVDDEPVLALAGGGIDLSPGICQAYLKLGYYPPMHFASGLPRLGVGYSWMSKELVEACSEGARIASEWAMRAAEELEAFSAKFDQPKED